MARCRTKHSPTKMASATVRNPRGSKKVRRVAAFAGRIWTGRDCLNSSEFPARRPTVRRPTRQALGRGTSELGDLSCRWNIDRGVHVREAPVQAVQETDQDLTLGGGQAAQQALLALERERQDAA